MSSAELSRAPELELRVARKRVEALDICSFELVDPFGYKLPQFAAGAHLDVQVGEGLTRQYSLYNEVLHTDSDSDFDAQLASSGRVIRVGRDQTLAQALLAAGVTLTLSCEQGVCGTCLTGVLAGIPDHRDSYLTAEERAANRSLTPCCSRARSSRLVLDL